MSIIANSTFWTNIKESNTCWIWTGFIAKDGYGRFSNKLAHRQAWELVNGSIPSSMIICHKCDNRRCVNPDHLFLGTDKSNAADKKRKNRSNVLRGEKCYKSKLTEEDVRNILSLCLNTDLSWTYIAKKLGVRRASIYRIVHGLSWGWLGRDNLPLVEEARTYLDSLLTVDKSYPRLLERFCQSIVVDSHLCWSWVGGFRNGVGGYGVFKVQNIKYSAHRFIWEYVYGPIEKGLVIRHKCHNSLCVKLSHLVVGTSQDNSNDMITANRHPHGETSNSKFTNMDILDIRSLHQNGLGAYVLAKRYSVCSQTIYNIINGKTWKHI